MDNTIAYPFTYWEYSRGLTLSACWLPPTCFHRLGKLDSERSIEMPYSSPSEAMSWNRNKAQPLCQAETHCTDSRPKAASESYSSGLCTCNSSLPCLAIARLLDRVP
ncbi:Transcription factor gsfR2 [Fusarium oxysporum f. sp. albedinis]|nr:Transcription factor gsfR2 [Fusarium oxysporum f. sp. albedinis]